MRPDRLLFLVYLIFASVTRAQTPTIDSMVVQPPGNELSLYGDFGAALGTVNLRGISLPVLIWSSDSIICSIAQPASGEVVVTSVMNVGPARILESMWVATNRKWGGSMGHDGISSSFNASALDTLFLCFDATTASQGSASVQTYRRSGAWSYAGNSFIGYRLPYGPTTGQYSATGSGQDSTLFSLSINRGVCSGNLPADTGDYSYKFNYIAIDSTGREIDSPAHSGIGAVTFPEDGLGFKLFDTTLTGSINGPDQLILNDPAAGNFFSWIQFGPNSWDNSGSFASIQGYSVSYPFPNYQGIVENSAAQPTMKLWPNPASKMIHVSSIEDPHTLELYSFIGNRENVNTILWGKELTFDVDGIPNGVYWVVVKDSKRRISQKLIVSH